MYSYAQSRSERYADLVGRVGHKTKTVDKQDRNYRRLRFAKSLEEESSDKLAELNLMLASLDSQK